MSAALRDLQDLVLVPGHAIYIGLDFKKPDADENWCLQSFQVGEPPFYMEHIRAGIETAAQAPDSMLVFSGGQTRWEAGPRSEGFSYWLVAESQEWFGFKGVCDRTVTEDFARDSLENLQFGILRFHEITGRLPRKIVAVGWKFKETRFKLHRDALRIPKERFLYVGVNNPLDLEGARKGEARAIASFEADPRGETGELEEKRRQRNPFGRNPPYRLKLTARSFV